MRLKLGRPSEAHADATLAYQLQPTPSRHRLQQRTALGAGRLQALATLQPGDLDDWPDQGRTLAADVRAALDQPGCTAHRLRAVLLSFLGRHSDALVEVERASNANAPTPAEVLLTRALIRHKAGDQPGALADLNQALQLWGDVPAVLEWRGRLLTESNSLAEAFSDLKRAEVANAGPTIHGALARAWTALGRTGDAVNEWTLAHEADSQGPDACLGRARCLLKLGRWDEALADLEAAAALSSDQPARLAQVARTYALCLVRYPDRLTRVLSLARRAAEAGG
jgi:tetratricopeptide (TPR) repeat protein